MKNQYFKVVRHINQSDNDFLTCIHIKQDRDIWFEICQKYLDTSEYTQQSFNDPYGSIYNLNIKEYLLNDYIDVYSIIKQSLSLIGEDINDPQIRIYIGTSRDYRFVNEKFDNEMSFLEYITSDIAEMNKRRFITESILKEAGFENITNEWESEYYKKEFFIDNYSSWRFWTDKFDKDYIKIDITKGPVNRGIWHVHIDDQCCESIGSADISTVWEFNLLMQVFGSKFKL